MQKTARGRPMAEDDSDTYWVMSREELQCLGSPRRYDIVDHLAAAGPLSIRELAGRIGAQPSALYHHLRQLLNVGLVVETGHQVRGRKRETVYNTRAKRMRMHRALEDPANIDILIGVVGAMSRQADRDFQAGISSPNARPSGPQRNLAVNRLVGSPSPGTLGLINAHLDAVSELLFTRGEGGERVAFTWVLAPLDTPADDEARPRSR